MDSLCEISMVKLLNGSFQACFHTPVMVSSRPYLIHMTLFSTARDMEKAYDPASVEEGVYEWWERKGLFALPHKDSDPLSIILPPPNVTGQLHIGHALTVTIQDAMIRRGRMQGLDVRWIPGLGR